MSVLKRIMEIQQEATNSQRSFELSIGKSSGYLNQLNKNDSMPSLEVILKILEVYPKYNLNWLALGEEPKYRSKTVYHHNDELEMVEEDSVAYSKQEISTALEGLVCKIVKKETDEQFKSINKDIMTLLKRVIKQEELLEAKKSG